MIGYHRIRRGLLTLYRTLVLARPQKQPDLDWRVRGFVKKRKEVIFVNPLAITRIAGLRANGQIHHVERPRDVVTGRRHVGMILDDGDIYPVAPFDQNWAVKACREHWEQGHDWRDTGYRIGYEVYVEKNLVKDWDEFSRTRLERWDRLFQDLTHGEYRTNKDPLDEVQVAVREDGEILFCDGKHRLTAAKILGYTHIPVVVNFWTQGFIDRVGSGMTPGEMARFLQGGCVPTPNAGPPGGRVFRLRSG